MNEQLLTISLLLMNAAMLGIVGLLMALRRDVMTSADDSLLRLVLHRLSDAARRQRAIMQLVSAEAKKTRKETQEIKTRLTWSRKRELADAEREGVQS